MLDQYIFFSDTNLIDLSIFWPWGNVENILLYKISSNIPNRCERGGQISSRLHQCSVMFDRVTQLLTLNVSWFICRLFNYFYSCNSSKMWNVHCQAVKVTVHVPKIKGVKKTRVHQKIDPTLAGERFALGGCPSHRLLYSWVWQTVRRTAS